MLGKNNLEERLIAMEKKMDSIINGNPQKDLSKEVFLKFYNKIKYDLHLACVEPLLIIINNKYSEALQNNVLYPSDNSMDDFWFVIGEVSPIPIAFSDKMKEDYTFSAKFSGTFEGLGII